MDEAVNQNISFAELVRNPKREKAEGALAEVLYNLEHQSDTEPSLLAEILFNLMMLEMEPDPPMTSEKAVTWLSQLHRFRDRLQKKINAFESLYEAEHH